MGGSKPKPPKVKYVKSPPPKTVQAPTQAFRTQLELAKVANAQQSKMLERGAELDRVNEEFFAGQDIRRLQAQGAESRLTAKVSGQEQRRTAQTVGSKNVLALALEE